MENLDGYLKSEKKVILNHVTAKLSDLDMKMVYSIPQGGNWEDIPDDIESKRVQQIKKSGGRTTYYGRLSWDKPSYTISTYFNRVGNGCFIHPEQNRLISLREGARLQSFPDQFVFYGSKTSIYKQIGNAVPPIMAYNIGKLIRPKKYIDLFCGAGGFSFGIDMAGGKCELAIDKKDYFCKTFKENINIDHDIVLCEDIKKIDLTDFFSSLNNIDLVIGGPPCQGFSSAGKNLLDDPRNELVKYFIKSIEVIQPKYFIMENVVGITFKRSRSLINEFYNRIEKIGYNLDHRILLASNFGVPQKRKRVIFIGNKLNKKIEFPKPLFSENGLVLPKFITVREAINDLPPIPMGGGKMKGISYASKPKSEYQKLMRGMIDFERFYKRKKQNHKKKVLTLDEFINNQSNG